MKKETDLTLGISRPELVDAYMENLQHPLLDVVKYLRALILDADESIGEGIFWNVPTFYFTGTMDAFEPKEYKRYIVGFNFYKQDTIRLIFLRGADASDSQGLLTGNFKDKRKIISFQSMGQVKNSESDLKKIIKDLIEKIND